MVYNWTFWLTAASAIFSILIKILIAVAIYRSARARVLIQHAPLRFFSPAVWAFVGFTGGIFALALYWVMHYSSFVKDEQREPGTLGTA